ncbi:uncharacterized protein [Haliotis asinina]|uniref:uncharacterized protein isoform X2 n=1 Tax=Haliotis asinina TaxID=109174 RepID=UPI003531B70F
MQQRLCHDALGEALISLCSYSVPGVQRPPPYSWNIAECGVKQNSLTSLTSGQTCSFMETTGQKGMDSLRSNSGNMTTDVDGCKTLCNTTELCIAGEFHSSTNKCFMYSLETSLTVQADTVFFRWNCPTGAVSDDDSNYVPVIVGCVVGVVVFTGAVTVSVVCCTKANNKRKTDTELEQKAEENEENCSLKEDE